MGFQASGSAPLVLGEPVLKPETIATAIRIGNPASWQGAINARDESGGVIDMVTDEEITEYQQLLANTDGVFCEPACAVSIAGVHKEHKKGRFKGGETVVSIVTGPGLKDPNRAIEISTTPTLVEGGKESILKILGL